MAMSKMRGLGSRLARGVAANALGKLYVAVMQLLSVPVFVSVWGASEYGVWIMLSTVPTYLALSDFGFSQAATADMAMKVARGEQDNALVTFQSLWRLMLIVSACIVALATLFLGIIEYLPGLHSWLADHAVVLWLLTCYAVAAQATRVVLTGFHSSGHYAFGTAVFDTLTFLEGLLVIGAALLGGHHLACALVLLSCRTITGIMLYIALRKRVGWLKLGLVHSSGAELTRLLHPAVGAMAIPMSLALNIQGMVLVVGAVLSPAAVASFTAVRTISRVAVQLVGIFGRASMPEISAARALGHSQNMSKILRVNLIVLAVTLVPAAAILALFGQEIVSLWTGGAIVPSASFVAIMAAGMVVQALWVLATQILLAMNQHGRIAMLGLVVSVATIAIAIPIAEFGKLNGIALVLLVSDVVLVSLAILDHILKKV
jgi:O-antigen/teichoic acid export membrane protein